MSNIRDYDATLYIYDGIITDKTLEYAIDHFASVYTVLPEILFVDIWQRMKLPLYQWTLVTYGAMRIPVMSPQDLHVPLDLQDLTLRSDVILSVRKKYKVNVQTEYKSVFVKM